MFMSLLPPPPLHVSPAWASLGCRLVPLSGSKAADLPHGS